MSLVGPRPELPEYVVLYSDRQIGVIAHRPGITSPASLMYIDEEKALAGQTDREDFYLRVLLPRKLDIDLAYCRNINLAVDLKILFATVFRLRPRKASSTANPLSGEVSATRPAV
jgi:lipopolysaccharide/colanic/teichoic acid biosynthesis glycosyltransferase